jgi:hypothetical protein
MSHKVVSRWLSVNCDDDTHCRERPSVPTEAMLRPQSTSGGYECNDLDDFETVSYEIFGHKINTNCN